MHFVKRSMLTTMLTTILTTLLLTAGVAEAASLSCGAWSIVTSYNVGSGNNRLYGVATVSANDVWAVGSYDGTNGGKALIKHWNGTRWKVVASPSPGSGGNILSGVTVVSANNVWAVGYDNNSSGSSYQTLIEHWNGTNWSIVASPNPSSSYSTLSGVVAVSANDVWAVGTYGTTNGTFQETLIEHWNGTNWSVVASPNPGNYDELVGVTAGSANDVWAVGDYVISNSNGIIQTLTEHWNGTNWNVVASPNPTSYIDTLSAVTVVSSSDGWAVGLSEDHSGPEQALIEHWNGMNWSVVASPNPGFSASLAGMTAVSASNVWAVGYYRPTNSFPRTLIEQWNGTSWNVVASPNIGNITNRLTGVAQVSGTSQVWAVGLAIKRGTPVLELTEFYC